MRAGLGCLTRPRTLGTGPGLVPILVFTDEASLSFTSAHVIFMIIDVENHAFRLQFFTLSTQGP